MTENPTLQIPKDIIEPIITAHVSAAILSAFADKSKLMEVAVAQVLNAKVDKDNGKPTSSSYNATSYIQWLMESVVRKAVANAIEEQVGLHKEELKKAIAAELGLGKKYTPLAKQLVNGMCSAMSHPDLLRYRIKVEFDDKK
jgi:hypothetical protein